MAARLVTVFGGSGFLGRYVVRRLAARGDRVRVAVRRPNVAIFLKPLGDVGQVEPLAANLRDPASVKRAVAGADAVVNLVGLLSQFGKQKFASLHVEGARAVAEAAAAEGVKTLVHVSAIGADTEAASEYARTKGEGEAAVLEAFPKATILRPSVLIGPEDDFFNRFAWMSKISMVLPIVGGKTRFQPVHVDDVAAAVLIALEGGRKKEGKVFELGGPRIYTFRELMDVMMRETGVKRLVFDMPGWLARIPAALIGWLPNAPLTLDQIKLLDRDNVVAKKAKTFAALGLTPKPIEVVLPLYLTRYRAKGQFSKHRPAA